MNLQHINEIVLDVDNRNIIQLMQNIMIKSQDIYKFLLLMVATF